MKYKTIYSKEFASKLRSAKSGIMEVWYRQDCLCDIHYLRGYIEFIRDIKNIDYEEKIKAMERFRKSIDKFEDWIDFWVKSHERNDDDLILLFGKWYKADK